MLSIFNKLFPFVENGSFNKKITNKIEKLLKDEKELVHMEGYSNLKLDTLKDFYNDSFDIKNKLEDKAKLNIAGLTISISLILGLSTLIGKINESIDILWIRFAVVLMSAIALLYMILAGILSIAVLIKHNDVYKVKPYDFTGDEEIQKRAYALNTELNVNKNIIRNNYIYTSYECIRNSFICLVIVFLVSILPMNAFKDSNNSLDIAATINKNDRLIFSEDCIKSIAVNEVDDTKKKVQDIVERSKNYINEQEYGEKISISDEKQKMFIQLIKSKGGIIVTEVEEQVFLLK